MLRVEAVCHHRRPELSAFAKATKLKPINRERAAVRKIRVRLRKAVRAFFEDQAPRISAQLWKALSASEKGARDGDPDDALDVDAARRLKQATAAVEALDFDDWKGLIQVVGPELEAMAVEGGSQALDQLGVEDDDVQALMRQKAEAWADERAAEMVGMRRAGGELVPNPDARWQITESTRDALRDLTEQALAEGWSADKLSSEISDSQAFSDARADMVARTEVALADVAGAMQGYRASGVVGGKQWITAEDDLVSDECQACADQGVIALDESFSSGADAPPNHPNCRCDVVAVLSSEMETDE